jgi:hypothetical protein
MFHPMPIYAIVWPGKSCTISIPAKVTVGRKEGGEGSWQVPYLDGYRKKIANGTF